ncbi:hypothetical protein GCM10029992_54450 [Glycomyces albus]
MGDDEISTLQANVGTAHSISHICGPIAIVLLASRIFPQLIRIDLREDAGKPRRGLDDGTAVEEVSREGDGSTSPTTSYSSSTTGSSSSD